MQKIIKGAKLMNKFTTEPDNEEVILAELDNLIGADYLKKQICNLVRKFEKDKAKYKQAIAKGNKSPKYPYMMNIRFEGAPGTGKTTIAQVLARLLFAKGVLTRPDVITFKPSDIYSSGRIGEFGEQIENRIRSGLGGVVFIDEFYTFDRAYNGGNLACEAIDAIMEIIEENMGELCLIVAGYEQEMQNMFDKFNPGLQRKFPYTIKFEPYSTDDLLEIFKRTVASDGKTITDDAMSAARIVIDSMRSQQKMNFGNVGFITDILIPKVDAEYLSRDARDNIYIHEDVVNAFPELSAFFIPNNDNVESILEELNNYDGMSYLKEQLERIISDYKQKKDKYNKAIEGGEKTPNYPYVNMRFVGAPGTGKTTVAHLLAKALYSEGIIPKPNIFQFNASDISAKYIGDIENQIKEKMKAGLGGVVVIDEFYNFNRGYSGGNIANEVFYALLEIIDKYKDNLCIIVLGYKKEIEDMFYNFNPGALRRFPYEVTFDK